MSVENEMTKEEYDKLRKRLKRERWEIVFAHQLDAEGLYLGEDPENLLPGEYAREYKFHPKRKWRFDFIVYHPRIQDDSDLKISTRQIIENGMLVAIEIEGGIYSQGRHTRGFGFAKDAEKYNHSTALGWKVFRFVPEMIKSGEAIKFLKKEVWSLE